MQNIKQASRNERRTNCLSFSIVTRVFVWTYFSIVWCVSQATNNMPKYMDPIAKTVWKNPYPYGMSSSDSSTFLNCKCLRHFLFKWYNKFWIFIDMKICLVRTRNIPVYICSRFPLKRLLQRCWSVLWQNSANFKISIKYLMNCQHIQETWLNEQCTYNHSFPFFTWTGFFFLVAACLWLTVQEKFYRQRK